MHISFSNTLMWGAGLTFLSIDAGLGPWPGLAAIGISAIWEEIRARKQIRQMQEASAQFNDMFFSYEPRVEATEAPVKDTIIPLAVQHNN